ncbi:hypothetical protein THAOC_00786 [Thalassiosira oceanica]|uniref:Uncharacterized protein n=1 Tax=Thalassiosira oceanica TaxID=159749 RepID=K0TR91_THAOC|nr:hypothetical protein THAOC_00786 [Thalassiosira oceanica]|eukprot:EJK77387.1 hypothetical protein THAOC_00786 [Thalassiosira oceanica]
MNVDWDEQLRLIAVIDNPSDMIDSNTDRSHTWDDISGMCNTSMGMDVLKYASNLLEAENAEIVKKIDITTMPFRDSFSVMFGLIVYYKKFLNLPPKSSSLFFQNLMQPPGVNLHRDGFTGLLRKDEYDLFGLSARAKKRKGDEKQTGIDRDRLVHRSIVAAGSTGKDLEECLERMEEATLRDRNNGFVVITDPKEISDKSRHFVRSARGEGFIDKVLTDMYEDKFRSKAANSGNKDNHNTSAYANLTTLDGELTHYKETGYEFFAQGAGSADINNPNWGKDFLVTTPSGEKIYKKMIIPSAGPLTYKDVLTGEVKTIDFDPRYFVAGAAAGNLKQRCSKSKYDQAVKAAEKQAAKGKASKRKKTVWFPDHQFQIKRGMAKFEQGKIVAVNEHNIIQGRFVRGGDGVIYYD